MIYYTYTFLQKIVKSLHHCPKWCIPSLMKILNAAVALFIFSASSVFADTPLKEITRSQIQDSLRTSNEVAKEVTKFGMGHEPFGALLLAPDNETVLMKQGNINVLHHAEIELVRRAADIYPPDYLAKCTLVANMEPCAMCAGAIYYANIGRVVFGVSRATLDTLIGSSKMNTPLKMTSKDVFQSGSKAIEIIGPIPEMEDELLTLQKTFWK